MVGSTFIVFKKRHDSDVTQPISCIILAVSSRIFKYNRRLVK